ncbi:restriction endonuclease [Alteriqipengyuania sp. NZ-12B]|uniref:Restriction endonuclease n=1 Tax=Alteriqipengyuania abyssalis TaxID=2860200 RepID=A0ABS7P9E7_9SPHN|nr:restriction endonuclease [Alteriqipengyuania abyssalis]MBY8335687.1 restriction endonuclease [Alteriqipengyuania abyssalis]
MMHDCILEIFWPKKKIAEFLVGAGCPKAYLPSLLESSRHEVVVHAFSRLGARDDRGYSVFQTLLDRLVNWSYFDPYWFKTMGKLDETSARQKLHDLKESVANRNAATTQQRSRAMASRKSVDKSASLKNLKKAFVEIYGEGMTAQARGHLFEKFLKLIFDVNEIPMGEPFRIVGEQIDGSFKFEGENYIVEAKWQDPVSSTSQLYTFAHKVDGKMHGRGVFISVNAFSNEAIEAIVRGKHIQTILVDGEDLSFILEGQVSLTELIDYKVRAAQTRGDVYVCAVRRESKI